MKEIRYITIVTILFLGLTGCQSVLSSELEDTKAENITIKATLAHKVGDENVHVNARVFTKDSKTPIFLDEGQDVFVSSLAEESVLDTAFLLESPSWLSANQGYYANQIEFIDESSLYQITYRDSSGVETSALIPMIRMADTEAFYDTDSEEIVLSWNKQDVSGEGTLHVEVQSGSETKNYPSVENSGDYACPLDAKRFKDYGALVTIRLTQDIKNPDGFGKPSLIQVISYVSIPLENNNDQN